MYANTPTHTHTDIYIYTHTQTYTHTQNKIFIYENDAKYVIMIIEGKSYTFKNPNSK